MKRVLLITFKSGAQFEVLDESGTLLDGLIKGMLSTNTINCGDTHSIRCDSIDYIRVKSYE